LITVCIVSQNWKIEGTSQLVSSKLQNSDVTIIEIEITTLTQN